jgi:hypothetical protein
MKLSWLPAILLPIGLSPGMAQWAEPPRPVSPQRFEDMIYQDVNAYRASMGLPAVPRSRSLDRVARAHVADLETWHPDQGTDARGMRCNSHSWSAHGAWTPVCYTPDHAYAANMWNKPAQITRGAYPGYGFEIAFGEAGAVIDPDEAIQGWKSSSAHNAVILEQGVWRDAHWQAMGVGVSRGYAVVWFGKEPDAASE